MLNKIVRETGLVTMQRHLFRVLRVLRESARKGRPCLGVAMVAGLARLTPSEVRAAAEELEARGLARINGDRVCYNGALDRAEEVLLNPLISRVLEYISSRRDIVYGVEEVRGSIPFVDIIIARRDGIVFLIRLVRREPLERLVAIARKLAKIARHVAEGKEELPVRRLALRMVVPVLVGEHGASRIIEGVVFKPADRLVELVLNPWPEINHPLIRAYTVRQSSST